MIDDQEYEELIYRKQVTRLAAQQYYNRGKLEQSREYLDEHLEICKRLESFIKEYKMTVLFLVTTN